MDKKLYRVVLASVATNCLLTAYYHLPAYAADVKDQNKVISSAESGPIAAGETTDGNVTNNKLTLNNNVFIPWSYDSSGIVVCGGKTTSGNASNNEVIFDNAVSKSSVSGGYTANGNASNNKVTIKSKSYNWDEKFGEIYGGYTKSGNATGNEVNWTETGSSMVCGTGNILCGGKTDSGNAVANKIFFKNVNTDGLSMLYGGVAKDGNADSNIIEFESAKVNITSEIAGGMVATGSKQGDASNNKLIIRAVKGISSFTYGGVVKAGNGSALKNQVVIEQGSISSYVYGGYAMATGSASENNITINGGNIATELYGGRSNTTGNATANSVDINGGSFTNAKIYGGYTNKGTAQDNVINVRNAPDLSGATLYGGYSASGPISNNILNWYSKDVTVQNIVNFAKLNFYLPDNITAGDTLLTIADKNDADTDLKGSTITITTTAASTGFNLGDSLYLINKTDSGSLLTDATTVSCNVIKGVSLQSLHEVELTNADNKLTATLISTKKDDELLPQTKSFSEGQAAAASFINSGANLVSDSIGKAAAETLIQSGTFIPFAGMEGGKNRYETGSHVDMHGWNIALGIAKDYNLNNGTLTWGPFFEYGHGNYSTHNDFGDGEVYGSGKSKYYGAGVLSRYKLSNGIYYEGALRFGSAENDYKNSLTAGQYQANYKTKAPYVGFQLGLGKIMALSEQTKLDLYSKYFWSHVSGDTASIAGHTYDFKGVDSHRLRIGALYTYKMTALQQLYAGLAYEYEFGGEVNATVEGRYKVDAPSFKGASGIVELGYKFKSTAKSPLTFSIGAKGYLGQNKGFSGNIKLDWMF